MITVRFLWVQPRRGSVPSNNLHTSIDFNCFHSARFTDGPSLYVEMDCVFSVTRRPRNYVGHFLVSEDDF